MRSGADLLKMKVSARSRVTPLSSARRAAIVIAIATADLYARGGALAETRRIEESDQAFLAVLLVNAVMRSRMSGPTPGFLYTSYESPTPSESPSVSISSRLFAR